MRASTVNSLWAGVIAEELSELPTGPVCLTPGSRNTPLTVSLTQNEDLTVLSHLDERVSGFFGVGVGRATGDPAILVSTSGTATAEFHPAVLEAYQDRVPLLVFTADRPPELHDSGANQTIDQTNLYGEATRWSRTLPEPETKDRKIRSLRTTINRAVHQTTADQSGPVHLNVPLAKPLEPGKEPDPAIEAFLDKNPLADTGRPERPYTQFASSDGSPSVETLDTFRAILDSASRPILHFGPIPSHRRSSFSNIRTVARDASIPRMADPLSGQRYESAESDWHPLTEYEFLLPELDKTSVKGPDLILRLGHPPNASNALMDYFATTSARQVLVADNEVYTDAQFRVSDSFGVNPPELFRSLDSDTLNFDTDWARSIQRLDETLRHARHEGLEDGPEPFEGDVLEIVLEALSSNDTLVVGNSTPVRDLIQYSDFHDQGLKLTANRGTSGIDGQISTAAGYGHDTEGQAVSVLGDISFYHDLTGLLSYDRHNTPGVIVVINNDGGGIFHRLPVEDVDPPFTDFVKAPHDLTFESAAEQFNADYERAGTLEELKEHLETGLQSSDLTIIEVPTDAERNQRYRERLQEFLRETLTEASATS